MTVTIVLSIVLSIIAAILILRWVFAYFRVRAELQQGGDDVFIPPEKEAVLNDPECVDWIETNTCGYQVVQRELDGRLHVLFPTKREGQAFRERWLR